MCIRDRVEISDVGGYANTESSRESGINNVRIFSEKIKEGKPLLRVIKKIKGHWILDLNLGPDAIY